jgi:hypothetical protein
MAVGLTLAVVAILVLVAFFAILPQPDSKLEANGRYPIDDVTLVPIAALLNGTATKEFHAPVTPGSYFEIDPTKNEIYCYFDTSHNWAIYNLHSHILGPIWTPEQHAKFWSGTSNGQDVKALFSVGKNYYVLMLYFGDEPLGPVFRSKR